MTDKFVRAALISLAVCTSGYALAKGTAPLQNHHCKLADGSMDMTKTHKACTAAKGTWVKDAASAPAVATPAPSTSASTTPAH